MNATSTRPLAALSLVVLLPALGTSTANMALPTLTRDFAAPFAQVQWVVLAYLLSITALIVSIGRLGDLLGKRRLLLVGVTLFTLASALCAVAPSLGVLIAARAVQGIGAAVMMALGIALVGTVIPSERTGRAMGLMGSMSAVGTALGPSLGGWLIALAGWPAIFLVNLPLGLVAWLLVRRHLPAAPPKADPQSIDLVGTALLTLTLAAYALATTPGRGEFGWSNLGLLGAAAVGLAAFRHQQSRHPAPLLRPRMFADRALSAGLGASAIVATVVMATLVVGPFYLSRGLGLSPALVGMAVTAGPAMAALAALPAGRLVDRLGTQRTTSMGLLGVGAAALALALLPMVSGVAGYVGPLMVLTGSYALFQTANNSAVMAGVASDNRGVVSGLLNLSRNLGLVSGASAMGAVFALGAGDLSQAMPEQVGLGMRLTYAVAAVLALVGWRLVRGVRRRG
ncbi:MAG: MFS transporter [Magnetospirillum gryphiswaldense]|nr:MFS transporter [Magnetospirillum gryphiswaldense]